MSNSGPGTKAVTHRTITHCVWVLCPTVMVTISLCPSRPSKGGGPEPLTSLAALAPSTQPLVLKERMNHVGHGLGSCLYSTGLRGESRLVSCLRSPAVRGRWHQTPAFSLLALRAPVSIA